MSYHDDPVDYEERLNAKMQPESIRATLAFAAIYQMANEMIRRSVVDRVRDFYELGFDKDGSMRREDEEQYRIEVSAAGTEEPVSGIVAMARSKRRNHAESSQPTDRNLRAPQRTYA